MKDIKEKNALITGASSGIGWKISHELAECGCNLIIVARSQEKLNELKQEIIRKHQVDVHIITQDLSANNASENLYNEIKDLKINVDILINNAGYGIHKYFLDTPWEKQKNMLDLLVVNLTHLTKLCVDDMVKRNFGYIMLTASTGAFQPTPSYATYAATKSYVLNFGLALNYELRKTNVHCSVLCPGYTVTGFQKAANQNQETLYMKTTKMTAEQVANIAVKKMFKRKAMIIAGRANAINARLSSLLPKKLGACVSLSALGEPDKKQNINEKRI